MNYQFNSVLVANYPGQIYVEGATRQTNVLEKWFELRLTGPYFRPQSGFWRIDIDYDVLVACNINDDVYTIDRMVGDAAAAFAESVPLYKLGSSSPDPDDGSLITCLQLDTNGQSKGININHFGLIQPSETVIQASVEGKYFGLIDSDSVIASITPNPPIVVDKFIIQTSSISLKPTDSGNVYSNAGAGSEVDLQLPVDNPPADAIVYTLVCEAAQIFKLVAVSGATIRFGGSVGTFLYTNTPGSLAQVLKTSPTTWVVISSQGDWSIGP